MKLRDVFLHVMGHQLAREELFMPVAQAPRSRSTYALLSATQRNTNTMWVGKKFRDVSCMWEGGTPNLQGGAIYAENTIIKIHLCTFSLNTASDVSGNRSAGRTFHESALIPGAPIGMGLGRGYLHFLWLFNICGLHFCGQQQHQGQQPSRKQQKQQK